MNSFIRIDNAIVERKGTCYISYSSVKAYEKLNKVKLNLEEVPYVSTGHRRTDGLLIEHIMERIVKWDDLDIIYPFLYILK